MRIVQISDPHLSPSRPDSAATFDQVLRWLNADPPDLVIATGDLAELDPDSVDERHFAHERLSRLIAPLLTLPGNHDVGENGTTAWRGPIVTLERVEAYLEVWGNDRWVVERDGWRLVGVNLITPAPLSEVQWLDRELGGATGPIAVFLHKPVCMVALDVFDDPGWSAEREWRAELVEVLESARPRFVASGHLHAFRVHTLFDDCTAVWAPSTFFEGKDRGHGSTLEPGVVEYKLEPEGWQATYRSLVTLG